MNKTVLAHISVVTLNFLYALSYFIIKGVTPNYIPASGFVLLRAVGATLLFLLVTTFLPKEKVEWKDKKKLAFASISGVVINQLGFFHGLVHTNSINTAIIMCCTPIIVLPVSRLLIGERITKNKVIGLIIGFIGASWVIVLNSESKTASNPLLGNLMIFMNAAVFSFYLVYTKPIMAKYSTFTVLKWVFLPGTIMLLPIGLPDLMSVKWDFPPDVILSIAYVIIGITFFTFFLNMFALKHINPSAVSVYIFSQPFMTAVLAWLINKEVISWMEVIGCILIFTGVYFVSIRKS